MLLLLLSLIEEETNISRVEVLSNVRLTALSSEQVLETGRWRKVALQVMDPFADGWLVVLSLSVYDSPRYLLTQVTIAIFVYNR